MKLVREIVIAIIGIIVGTAVFFMFVRAGMIDR